MVHRLLPQLKKEVRVFVTLSKPRLLSLTVPKVTLKSITVALLFKTFKKLFYSLNIYEGTMAIMKVFTFSLKPLLECVLLV